MNSDDMPVNETRMSMHELMDNEGGPAFPLKIHDGNGLLEYPGMTLRDYFAAKAMQGLVAAWGHHDVTDFAEISADAYMVADAMLAAREES